MAFVAIKVYSSQRPFCYECGENFKLKMTLSAITSQIERMNLLDKRFRLFAVEKSVNIHSVDRDRPEG